MELRKNIKPGICAAKYCNHKVNGTRLCSTCRSKKCRENDPVKYAFTALKNNAKRRNILFTITLEQFREWCSKVIYIGHAGRASESYTIDRRHNDIGYHIDNIKVMKKGDNVKKYFYYDYRTKLTAYSTIQPEQAQQVENYF